MFNPSDDPLIRLVKEYRPVLWTNGALAPYEEARRDIPAEPADIAGARERFRRWEPELERLFPGAFAPEHPGVIESPLVELSRLPGVLAKRYGHTHATPQMLLKLDSHLPVSGSIKARGGFHEVLTLTEKLAAGDGAPDAAGDGTGGSPALPGPLPGRGYSIAVGSTGNLGLSIGILGAALGYAVTVHMSRDARLWKKDLLRTRGVTVVEHTGDFGAAVAAGRAAAERDPRCHFVDDERSRELFLGYAAAARPLRSQLEEMGIPVDRDHPLYVYLPCGVGGGPGGVTFGLKEEFGDDVLCYFVEPTHAPAMLLGLATGLHHRIGVEELGLDNRTVADGLAVGRSSGLVAPAMRRTLSGVFTLPDEEMLALVSLLAEHEGYRLEPSAVAGLPGPFRVAAHQRDRATHLVWATGGNMVPPEEMDRWIREGSAMNGPASQSAMR
ncbi:MAG: D-serine ammonia-lyase [Spirochaetaceae bacterium]|nr:MAG: D-serine ammonia-lyase [Spirochaetaceae bacterium]